MNVDNPLNDVKLKMKPLRELGVNVQSIVVSTGMIQWEWTDMLKNT